MQSAQTAIPHYVPGDQIQFAIEFGHKANIKRVLATCAYQGDKKTNLSEFTIPGKITHQLLKGGYKHSTAHFTSDEVPSNVAPGGEYRVVKVFLESYLGTGRCLQCDRDVGMPRRNSCTNQDARPPAKSTKKGRHTPLWSIERALSFPLLRVCFGGFCLSRGLLSRSSLFIN